jgi:hypothetical protein
MYVAFIKQFPWQGNPHPVWVTKMVVRLDSLDLKISVSPQMNRSSGFVRIGYGEPYLETWDGRRVTGPDEIRCYCLYLDEHRERISRRVRRRIAALLSAGNHGPNIGCVFLLNDPENVDPEWGPFPVLYRRRDEDERIRARQEYFALIIWKDGQVSAERVRFLLADEGNQGRVLRLDGEDLTDRVRYVLTAPPLVWEGEALSLSEMVSHWKGDIRHLIGCVEVPLPDGRRMVLAEAELLSEEGLLQDAAAGKTVAIPLRWKPDYPEGDPVPLPSRWAEVVRQACRDGALCRPYEEVPGPSGLRQRGQFCLTRDGRTLLIRFREGIYPHSVLGVNPEEGTLINLQVPGLSGHVGSTLVRLSHLARREGAYFWGVGQGGDRHLMAGDFLESGRPERWRVSAALAFVLKAALEEQIAWDEPLVYTPHLAARERQSGPGAASSLRETALLRSP